MSVRVAKMLAEQEHQCGLCKRPINNGNYFDADVILICGRCALRNLWNNKSN